MKRETRAWLRQLVREDMDKSEHPAIDALAADAEVRRLERFVAALEAWDLAVKAACRGVGGLPDHMLARIAALKARRSP